MNQFGNLSEEQLQSLLAVAGRKLGRDPKTLRKDLESGKLDNVLRGMDGKTAQKINRVLQNPEAVQTALNNDKVRTMLNNLLDKKA